MQNAALNRQSAIQQRGLTLILAVVILAAILAIGISMAAVVVGELTLARDIGKSFHALFAADQALERTFYNDRVLNIFPAWTTVEPTISILLPDGSQSCYNAIVIKNGATDIIGRGFYDCRAGAQKVQRTLQATYALPPGFPPAPPGPPPGPPPPPTPGPGPQPPPVPVAVIRNTAGTPIARFDENGDLTLLGALVQSSGALPSADDFRIQNSIGDDVAFITADTGTLHIDGLFNPGTTVFPVPGPDDFVLFNTAGDITALITSAGEMYIRGVLFENGIP
ncbi:MAG: hypothetical protein AAB539_02495 [Patescibacteria group bacterium]